MFRIYKKAFDVIGGRSGAVAVLVALLMVVFIGIAAIALDLAHLFIVRNELQNAADAAALDGANLLFPAPPSGFTNTPSPNWTSATNEVIGNAPSNASDGIDLKNYDVTVGYWNLSGTPYGLQSTSITPGPLDAPAVQVTVSRSGRRYNGGAVRSWFARVFGVTSSAVSATATAACFCPNSVKAGELFPMAISQEMAGEAGLYNSPSNTKNIGPGYPIDPAGDVAGQWTSFAYDLNNIAVILHLMGTGNPAPVSVGDNIWVEPATDPSLYAAVPVGTTVLLPVVNTTLNGSAEAAVPVAGFIGFNITGSGASYVQGYFVGNVLAGANGPTPGPYFGVYRPSVLVQ